MTTPLETPDAVACPICANSQDNEVIQTREMMFGTREAFSYGACARCGSWWLISPPSDLSPYYPPDYYSFTPPKVRASQGLKHRIGRPLLWGYLRGPQWYSALIDRARKMPPEVRCLSMIGLRPDSSLIDVGTGAGKYLVKLHRLGFSNVTGVDKFIDADSDLGFGIHVYRGEASDIDRQFDVVTSHHSFEHAPDPRAELRALSRLAKPGGAIVIRTPNADSQLCRQYRGDWFELDPPRHLNVVTPAAMELLAEEAGLVVVYVSWDSTPESILASEGYRNDIPFRSDARNVGPREKREAVRKAAQNDQRGEGDRMCVVLRKPE